MGAGQAVMGRDHGGHGRSLTGQQVPGAAIAIAGPEGLREAAAAGMPTWPRVCRRRWAWSARGFRWRRSWPLRRRCGLRTGACSAWTGPSSG